MSAHRGGAGLTQGGSHLIRATGPARLAEVMRAAGRASRVGQLREGTEWHRLDVHRAQVIEHK